MRFKGVDYYDIDELLSDAERMTRNVVREFLEKEKEAAWPLSMKDG